MSSINSFIQTILKTDSTPAPSVLSKVTLSNNVKAKLLSYQEPHVLKLVNILLKHKIALDNSDTGIGKSYAGIASGMELGKRFFIIAPKSTMYSWRNVVEYMGASCYDIVNYETAKNGKTYVNSRYLTRKKSPYISLVEPSPHDPLKLVHKWKLPSDAMIIIDEAHKCKGSNTDIGRFILSTKQLIEKKIPVLLLSATICEKIQDMRIPFYLFGILPTIREFKGYIRKLVLQYPQYKTAPKRHFEIRLGDARKAQLAYETSRNNNQALMVYEEIKEYTSRIRIKDLGTRFPANQWYAQLYNADDANEIEEMHQRIAYLKERLRENPHSNHLARIQKLKQEIELRKVPIFLEQAEEYLREGNSVIIFVNYLDTLHMLTQLLNIRCQIYGGQSVLERQEAIDMFQSNREKIIICQMKAGGVGIGLHDLTGDHPRVTLLNYPDQGSALLQALGRAPRIGAKSAVRQRIICVTSGDNKFSYEKKIMQNINRKLTNISAINDKDLDCYKRDVKKMIKKKPITVAEIVDDPTDDNTGSEAETESEDLN